MKRWLVRIFVLLMLGAIVNVAVAWGLAALPSDHPLEEAVVAQHGGSQMSGEWTFVAQRRTLGKTQSWYQGIVAEDILVTDDGRSVKCTYYPLCGNDDSGPWDVAYPVRSTAWSRLGFVDLGSMSTYIEAEIASGWPALSVWGCMAGYDRDAGEKMHVGCIGVGRLHTTASTDSHETCLPYRPIWPGFAINTMFYATLLWLLFFMPFAMRRRWRGGRGLCPKCAYDLRGSAIDSKACPECGVPR